MTNGMAWEMKAATAQGAALHESSGDESLGAWVKQWKEPDDEWNGVSDESLGLETKQEKEQDAVS